MNRLSNKCLRFIFTFLVLSSAPLALAERVAVVVFSSQADRIIERTAQTRVEEILLDNEHDVIDREKLKELKNNWEELSDPTLLITAEDILERQETFKFDELLIINVNSEVINGIGGIYLASAHADIRFIDSEAKVKSYTSLAMGTIDSPISEGITAKSALVNALRRSVESAIIKHGYEVYDETRNKSVRLKLVKTSTLPSKYKPYSVSLKTSNDLISQLQSSAKKWTKYKLNCSIKVQDTPVSALGIKESITNLMSRKKSHKSMLYLYDEESNSELNHFDIESSGTTAATKRKKGYSSDIQDCAFINTWKYIVVTTRNQIKLFDTERGIEIAGIAFDSDMKNNKINVYNSDKGDFISVSTPNNNEYFELRK